MSNYKSLLACLFVFGIATFFMNCDSDKKQTQPVETEEPAQFSVPRFVSDSAYNYVAKQVEFGPRIPNTDSHKATKKWLVEKLKSFGTTVIEQDFKAQSYDGKTLEGTNIIAQINPEKNKRLLLGAHWDTRPFADSPVNEERRDEPILGADDAGSGVGVLLEIARQLQENPLENMGVDIILFDAEDYGDDESNDENSIFTWCLGSQHWGKNPHVRNYKAKYGILLDMVGAKDARFPKERKSLNYAPGIVEKVWKLAQGRGYGNYFKNNTKEVGVDDHVFVNEYAKIPMIDIINMPNNTPPAFGRHWHTHDDNMDIISKKTLRVVGQTVLEVIYREAAGKL